MTIEFEPNETKTEEITWRDLEILDNNSHRVEQTEEIEEPAIPKAADEGGDLELL